VSTRWEIEQAARELHPEDFIYLSDGPRAGDRLIAPGHSGKVCLAYVPNGVPKLGAELLYEPVQGVKTADGMRVYRLVVQQRFEVFINGQDTVSNVSPIRPLAGSPKEGA
jgi:hypothetical protein